MKHTLTISSFTTALTLSPFVANAQSASGYLDEILDIPQLITYWFAAIIIYQVWRISRDYAREKGYKTALLYGLLFAGVVIHFTPLLGFIGFGVHNFLMSFILLYVPAAIGAFEGREKSPRNKINEILNEFQEEQKNMRKEEVNKDSDLWWIVFDNYRSKINDVFD
jgi:hypothetical protein